MERSLTWDDATVGISAGSAPARAALAGNPSDGFGGAVLATVVPGLAARVHALDNESVVVGDRAWPAPDQVTGPHEGEGALLSATVERLVAWCRESGRDVPAAGVALEWSSTIPRSVGLAGSSALVVAGIRALAPRWGLDLDVITMARLALEVETDVLGIAAGPQDRLTQAADGTVLMDFGGLWWAVEEVEPAVPLPLFVAWSEATSAPSHTVHGPLQGRRDEPEVRTAMAELARLAHAAAAAARAGDLAALGMAMDGSYDVRASIVDLDAAHVALVEGARRCGAPVNYAGSGGAVVGLAAGADVLDAARAWAEAEGLGFTTLTVGGARRGWPGA